MPSSGESIAQEFSREVRYFASHIIVVYIDAHVQYTYMYTCMYVYMYMCNSSVLLCTNGSYTHSAVRMDMFMWLLELNMTNDVYNAFVAQLK